MKNYLRKYCSEAIIKAYQVTTHITGGVAMGGYKMRQGGTKEGLLSLLTNEQPQFTVDNYTSQLKIWEESGWSFKFLPEYSMPRRAAHALPRLDLKSSPCLQIGAVSNFKAR